jgi:hypothetical protein
LFLYPVSDLFGTQEHRKRCLKIRYALQLALRVKKGQMSSSATSYGLRATEKSKSEEKEEKKKIILEILKNEYGIEF